MNDLIAFAFADLPEHPLFAGLWQFVYLFIEIDGAARQQSKSDSNKENLLVFRAS